MLKAKNKTYYSFFIFLVTVTAVFFVATSLISKLKSDSDKIKDQNILLSHLNKQKSQIGRIRADYQNQEKKMEKVEKSFLNPKETVDFVVEVEGETVAYLLWENEIAIWNRKENILTED